jgi:preprotein translocase subunit SecG
MPERTSLKALLAAFLVTVAVACIAILTAVLMSMDGSGAGGIEAYSGGVGSRFMSLLALALPVVFALAFLVFRRPHR